jgi:hypothetical protein
MRPKIDSVHIIHKPVQSVVAAGDPDGMLTRTMAAVVLANLELGLLLLRRGGSRT